MLNLKTGVMLCTLAVVLVSVAGAFAMPQDGEMAEVGGLVLQTLSAEELNDIKAETGRRFGVEVILVRPDSPGAAAGFQEGDIITAVGSTGVDSAPKTAALLTGAGGQVACTVMAVNLTTFQMETKIRQLQLSAGRGPSVAATPDTARAARVSGTARVPATSSASETTTRQPVDRQGAAPAVVENTDPVTAYFNLMDFACSQAWNRQVVTPAPDRQRVAFTLQQSWHQMNAQSQSQVMALPRAWTDLQQSWKSMSEAERNKKRGEWRDQILLPSNYFAPPAQAQRFTAENNLLAFEYPALWTGGWQVINGTGFLFIGPGGGQATWDRILNTQTSPPGALFALVTLDAQMRQLNWAQGARYLTQLLMPGVGASFREVQLTPIGQAGAIITLRGSFPGQNEERFYWIGITAFGTDQVFAGRLGGPVSQAMDLLPAFHHLLSTLQLNPPRPASSASGGGMPGAWEAAWSRVGTAAVANIWAK